MMTKEFERTTHNGWSALATLFLITVACIASFIFAANEANQHPPTLANSEIATWMIANGLAMLITVILWTGFFTLQPNEAAVLILFGAYRGTAKRAGFHWANPFYKKSRISLRARTLNGDKLKVNDQRGNPVDIAAVVVWHVEDTCKATFDVEKYESYVSMQSETAVRHLASAYPYDSHEEHQLSLRGSMDEVSNALREELQQRLAKAGVVVDEARLSHLAYSPEIAGVMLRRQQAEAVVSARFRIVEGAVSMVQLALEHLEKSKIVELDSERKAAMVSNLLVVLCGEQAAQPVLNTGTLYS